MKRMSVRGLVTSAVLCCLAVGSSTFAAVTPDEANRLKTLLTPLGGEKAGNKEGTIPAWDGGYIKVAPGFKPGDKRADPFSNEKPRFSITAKNMDQHADKLSEGIKGLLKKYPESMRLDIYPTHRTAAAPQWLYDNTFKNATRAKTTDNGYSMEGAYGGVPFPIVKDGAEVMWNHVLRWRGYAISAPLRIYVGAADGKLVFASEVRDDHWFPYYDKNGSLEKFKGDYWMLRHFELAPPFKAGEQILIRDPVNQMVRGRQAWQYLTGQRRVRRAPTISFDTPDFVASNQNYFDEVFMFMGSLERYEWKLMGKKEMYVPYNNNRFFLAKLSDVLSPHHLNPDHVRWELHRVWVVEATLAEGKRHVVPKRRFYVDEDTWSVLLIEGYDARGQLWRAHHTLPFVAPDIPAVVAQSFIVFDLQRGSWVANNLYNEQAEPWKVVDPWPETYFTPEALAAGGVR